MRTHRRRGPLDHVVVAGTLEDVGWMRSALALLPGTAYGQVYVETGPEDAVPPLTTPARVAVTRVVRAPGAARGSAVAAAVAAWTAEWMPEATDPDRAVTAWVGAASSADLTR